MIANTRKDLLLMADSLTDGDYPISLYPSSISIIELDNLLDLYKGEFTDVPVDDMCSLRSKAIFLMNKFVEEVGSAIRNTSVSYAYKKIRRSQEMEALLKEYNATASNNLADGHIQSELEVFAEREGIQELMKMKFTIYKEFIHDLTQQIALRRKEIDMGIAQ